MDKKRGVSSVVAYALLILLTIALAIMVYAWLKFYADSETLTECSENVNLHVDIIEYACDPFGPHAFEVDVRNNGLWSVDGYILRHNNETGAKFGVYVLNDTGTYLGDGENSTYKYPYFGSDNITFVDVQPFIIEDGKRVLCRAYGAQKVSCTSP